MFGFRLLATVFSGNKEFMKDTEPRRRKGGMRLEDTEAWFLAIAEGQKRGT